MVNELIRRLKHRSGRHGSEIDLKPHAAGECALWHDVASDALGVPHALKQCSKAKNIGAIAGTRYPLFRAPFGK